MQSVFWWPRMKRSVARHVRACKICPRVRGYPTLGGKTTAGMRTSFGRGCFDILMVDFLGPIRPAVMWRGRLVSYIATAVAIQPRWVWLGPLGSCAAGEFADWLLEDVLLDLVGSPVVIRRDRGGHFTGAVTRALGKAAGSGWVLGSSFNSRSQAGVETHHARTNSYRRARFLERGTADTWPTDAKSAQWLRRASKIAGLGVSPFQVIKGLAPRHNFDCSAAGEFWSDFWGQRFQRMADISDEIHRKRTEEQQGLWMSEQAERHALTVGETVWVKREHIPQLDGDKQHAPKTSARFAALADGPYLVEQDPGQAARLRPMCGGGSKVIQVNKRGVFRY